MEPATIKRLLKETRHTQRELAAHLDVDPAAITRLLRGERRLRLDEAPKVAAFFGLGQAQAAETYIGAAPKIGGEVSLRPASGGGDPERAPRDLPVYGSAQGGPDGMSIDYQPIEYMRRPQALEGVLDAFAFYVVGDSMSPRFRHGERLLVHPRRPVRAGDDILLILKDAGQGEANPAEVNAMVKTYLGRKDGAVLVQQYNPPRDFEVEESQIDGMLLIVGSYFFG